MRYYPFGSSSFNPLYSTVVPLTASISEYAGSASFGILAVTASYAFSGSPGLPGTNGTCSYQAGPTGPTGPTGFTGPSGGTSGAQGLI